jgi:TetR/AcrR family transcriptional repressor of lmrAB and yxaGH operons
MASETRQRMVSGAVRSMARRGVTASSFSDIVTESGAPRGSIYYHFPGGKEQLMGEAITLTTQFILDRFDTGKSRSATTVARAFLDNWRRLLVNTEFRSGCAVAAAVVDGDSESLAERAAEAFAAWRARLAQMLTDGGLPAKEATSFANLMLAACEGAVIIGRAERSVESFDDVAASLTADLRRRMTARPAKAPSRKPRDR